MRRDISRELEKLSKLGRKLSTTNLGNVDFNYEQQELIRRVFKSVHKQLKNKRDMITSKEILDKTEWIEYD